MRALVLSDIYSNLPALEAVLAAAPEYNAVWNLGDIVGYGADPNAVVGLARKLGGIVVRGNHDRACGDPFRFSQHYRMSATAGVAAGWPSRVLTDENSEWLKGLLPGPVKPLRRNLICVHGSPRDEDAYISGEYGAEAALNTSGARIVLFGHTHEQVAWIATRRALYPLEPDFPARSGAVQFELPFAQPQSLSPEPRISGPTSRRRLASGIRYLRRCCVALDLVPSTLRRSQSAKKDPAGRPSGGTRYSAAGRRLTLAVCRTSDRKEPG